MDTTASDGNLSPPFRFNLRSLLFAIALLSIPLTLLHWLGPYFLVPIVCSTGLALICCMVYDVGAPQRMLMFAGLAFPIGIAMSFFYMMTSFSFGGSGTFLFHVLINFGACLVCAYAQGSKKVLILGLSIAAIYPYFTKAADMQKIQHQYDQMLADHPLESLEERLAFQDQTTSGQLDDALQVSSSALSPTVSSNLVAQQQRYDRQRAWALTQLHENYRTQFAAAAGFGYMRMRRLHPTDLAPEPIEFVQLPIPVSSRLLGEDSSTGAGQLHQVVAYDFLNLDKMGYVRDRQHVSGFQSHSPTDLTAALGKRRSCGKDEPVYSWQLTRLELVSLLRHSTPRVYVSESLPSMDELTGLEHRPLSEFELSTLDSLKAEQDVVVEATGERILMVGALRASQDCLQCHQGMPGRLLGAFSYEFTPRAASNEVDPSQFAYSPGEQGSIEAVFTVK
ncbi:MAG: hypothetical protein ACR2NM_06375 [Bythopirellula sp.]